MSLHRRKKAVADWFFARSPDAPDPWYGESEDWCGRGFDQQMKIVIVGGGIGGLALAVALQKHGVPSVVCERAPELREIGAGLLLTPNASWVMDRLGLLEETRGCGQEVKSWHILDRGGRRLQRFGTVTMHAPSVSLTRTALQTLLLRQLPPAGVRLGRGVRSVKQDEADPQGSARVCFTDGSREEADLLVGADGGRSLVRDAVAAAAPTRFQGYVGWRALVPRVPEAWSEGLVTESWSGGLRFGIAPVGGGSSYWYGTENTSEDFTVPPGQRKGWLLERFKGWHAPVAELIEATPEEQILLHGIYDRAPLRRWSRGRIVLLGDAAHLMTPNLGQGAATALEDAWTLARCLAGGDTLPRALARYEKTRRARLAFVTWQARQIGRMIQWENPFLSTLRDVGMRLLPEWSGEWALAPVFRYRV